MKPTREVIKKGTDAALPTVRLARRVRRLEEGVRENALLAVPLEEQVARIEQSLVPLLEATQRWGAQRRRRG
ncbi:MAG TPA: hypothetical protein VHR85_12315 [Nocardioides sp.]|nr:hypothetical protein [Nocardioides sp.]